MSFRVTAFAVCAVLVSGSQQTLDCPLRQIALDFAMTLQPFRATSSFQELADALNGAQEAQNCSVAPQASLLKYLAASSSEKRGERLVSVYPLPTSGRVLYVDAGFLGGRSDGSVSRPYSSLAVALAALRAQRAAAGIEAAYDEQATLVLRGGTFYLPETLHLTRADSRTTLQAYPGEEVYISGATPLTGLSWAPATPPSRPLYEYRAGVLTTGFDAAPQGSYTLAAAQAFCSSLPTCAGFTYNSSDPNPTGSFNVAFKYNTFWAPGGGASTYIRNVGYEAGAANLYVADVSKQGLTAGIQALRVNGLRGVRARYPNVPSVELLGAMQIDAAGWTPQPQGTNADYTFNPPTPYRNNTIMDGSSPFFATFKLGVGGPCAARFTPQAGYWCANNTQGGGPGPYQAPVGMTVSNASSSLPHTPYTSNITNAVVHSWRAGRWFSWVFEIGSSTYDAATGSTTFDFTAGGNQGSRGGDAGQEMFIENVFDELDNPGEFYYDETAGLLYLWYNTTTGGTPPPEGSLAVPQLTSLINAMGNMSAPVVDIWLRGLGFRDSNINFLGAYGTPSGGDWAVSRTAALFFEGTEGTLIEGNYLTRLDSNAVFFSGYTRNASVSQNEFVWIGESCIVQWGYSDGSPVPGMGFDLMAGNRPLGTYIGYNLAHEMAIWTKQNSFLFQAETAHSLIEGNVAYNGPRAGINFNDGAGGGNVITRNFLGNFCRESSDHAPINTWDRQVQIFPDANGNPTTIKVNDTISFNYLLGNYHSSMCVDNDDGSMYFDTHDNVLFSAAFQAAYGGSSLKSDFGGNSNYHYNNLDLFFSGGFSISPQLPGYSDAYVNNTLYMTKDGNYGNGQACTATPTVGKTIVGDNTIWSPTGSITECGTTLAKWQSAGNDPGTTAASWPADSVVLALANNILGLGA